MVKWLSSEVSNLMSWVRLPLSAPPFTSSHAHVTAENLASIKGSTTKATERNYVVPWIFSPFAC